eukprot:11754739-Alexandrium_andersonii.AAC.1
MSRAQHTQHKHNTTQHNTTQHTTAQHGTAQRNPTQRTQHNHTTPRRGRWRLNRGFACIDPCSCDVTTTSTAAVWAKGSD